MNICLISQEYPSAEHTGGIGTYTEKTARALVQLDQTVCVITEATGLAAVTREDGVEVRRLAVPRTRRLRVVARAWAVAKAVAGLPCVPDIVQACEYRAEAFWIARRHPRTKLITRLATPTFLAHQLSTHTMQGRLRARVYVDWLERRQTTRSDAVISVSDALADVVCARWRIPRDRVRTIHNGVDFAQRYAAEAVSLPDALRGKDYVIYFGRLEERKGVQVLAEALPDVLAKHPALHVVFAGNSMPYRGQPMRTYVERCNAAFQGRLHFFPRLQQRDLHSLVAHALLAVAPSLWEALGNVCLEAQDLGKPVIATLGSGFGEVVEQGRSGLLVQPGDAQALRDALLSLLGDRGRLAQMSAAARIRAQDFRLDQRAGELLRFYQEVVASPARRMEPEPLTGFLTQRRSD